MSKYSKAFSTDYRRGLRNVWILLLDIAVSTSVRCPVIFTTLLKRVTCMIDFELTEDHKALVQTVREFGQKEVAPHIKEWDEKQHFEPSVLKNMAALNLLGVCIPEEYGGAGFDYISLDLFVKSWKQ